MESSWVVVSGQWSVVREEAVPDQTSTSLTTDHGPLTTDHSLHRNIQRFWPKGNNGEVAGWAAAEMLQDALGSEAVDGLLDLLETADPAQVVPVGGQRARPRGGRFLLHDQCRFQPCLDALHLIGFDAF